MCKQWTGDRHHVKRLGSANYPGTPSPGANLETNLETRLAELLPTPKWCG